MSIAQNDYIFNIASENQIATILSHFNSDYIMDSIVEKINSRNMYSMNNPNVVYSYELNFNQLKQLYPTDLEQISSVRLETYQEIIDILCKAHNLKFNTDITVDYYSAAFYLYDFLVCNFLNNIIRFYTKCITIYKSSIYDYIISYENSNKDINAVKKIYKDNKIATISANLNIALDYIKGMDITLDNIVRVLYLQDIAEFINNIVAPIGDFYRDIYVASFNDHIMMPEIITGIRLSLQSLYGVEMLPPIQQQ